MKRTKRSAKSGDRTKKKLDYAKFNAMHISVVKQRYICYRGFRLRYDTIIQKVGGRENLIQLLRELPQPFSSPPGLYGGIGERADLESVIDMLEGWGFRRKHFTIVIRFFVAMNGSLCPDRPINPKTGMFDWNVPLDPGYEKRSLANEAAELHYQSWVKRCVDDHGKITNVVTLTTHTKERAVIKTLTNRQ